MTSKDVFRRFLSSKEYQRMIDDPLGTSEAYTKSRLNTFDFSMWNQEEDFDFLEDLAKSVLNGGLPKKHRVRLKKYRKSFTGAELIDWFIYKSYSRSRLAAVSLAQRLHECSLLTHVSDNPAFEDSKEHLYHIQDAKDVGAGWPTVSTLLQQAEVFYGDVLLRGVLYHRLWAVLSKEHSRLFLFRSVAGMVAHSWISIKGMTATMHTATRTSVSSDDDWMSGAESKDSKDSSGLVTGAGRAPGEARTFVPTVGGSPTPRPVTGQDQTSYIQLHTTDGRDYVFLLETELERLGWAKALRALPCAVTKREWAITV